MKIYFSKFVFWLTLLSIVFSLLAIVLQGLSFFSIALTLGTALAITQIQYVKLSEDGVSLNSIFSKLNHLKWIEIEQLTIDHKYIAGFGGRGATLKFRKASWITFIPYPANNKKSIGMQYSRRALSSIKQYTSLSIIDTRPEF